MVSMMGLDNPETFTGTPLFATENDTIGADVGNLAEESANE